jgi:hypothetical protein
MNTLTPPARPAGPQSPEPQGNSPSDAIDVSAPPIAGDMVGHQGEDPLVEAANRSLAHEFPEKPKA